MAGDKSPRKTGASFGKHRTYICPGCARFCLRPLLAEPAACDHCGKSLANCKYKIDDVGVCQRNGTYTDCKLG